MNNTDKINKLMAAITDSISELVDEQAKQHNVDADELFSAVAGDMSFRAAMIEAFSEKQPAQREPNQVPQNKDNEQQHE
jgi:hypothetical protein